MFLVQLTTRFSANHCTHISTLETKSYLESNYHRKSLTRPSDGGLHCILVDRENRISTTSFLTFTHHFFLLLKGYVSCNPLVSPMSAPSFLYTFCKAIPEYQCKRPIRLVMASWWCFQLERTFLILAKTRARSLFPYTHSQLTRWIFRTSWRDGVWPGISTI